MYRHLKIGNGHLTISYNFRKETVLPKNWNDEKTVDYAIAYCSPRDQFCKAKGRSICDYRLYVRTRNHNIKVPFNVKRKDLIARILMDAYALNNMPRWIKYEDVVIALYDPGW